MKARLAIGLVCVCACVATCGAWTKHYSFSGGYPANGGVSASSAKAAESGGANLSATVQTRQRIASAEKSIVGRVTKIVDGDTITVTPNGGRGIRIRLRHIDAPESDQPGGDEATAFLKELIGGKVVEVKCSKRDDYGRTLGVVFMKAADGKPVDVNLSMVLNGWAWHYYPFKTNEKVPAYEKAEQDARNAKIGLWAEGNPIRPYDWRMRHRKSAACSGGNR